MTDLGVLVLVLLASTAAGCALLETCRAWPRFAGDRLLAAAAAGCGMLGVLGLILAEFGALRAGPIAAAGLLALAAGGRHLVALVRTLRLPRRRETWIAIGIGVALLVVELPATFAPPVGGDQTKYHLAYPRLYAAAHGLVPTPWTFWGQMQYLQNFSFAIGFALRGDVLARLFNVVSGVLATLALATLAGRHLGRLEGRATGLLFFTLPITWSLMTRAGADLTVVLFGALAVDAWLEWATAGGTEGALRRAALMAGFAGGSKVMGLLLPGLLGLATLAQLWRRRTALRPATVSIVTFGLLVAGAGGPCYLRNTLETGNPLYPFGYGLFGGRHWSAAAAEYLDEYYQQYQDTWAARREGAPYAGAAVARFPWDLTMTPGSFEKGAKQALDVSPFILAFLPAVAFVRRRRAAVLLIAMLGLADAGIIAVGAWAHPRYVLPGVMLLLVAAVAGARELCGRRAFRLVVALTVLSNIVVASRLLRPLWPDQVRVALGRISPQTFLERHSDRYVFWERANASMGPADRVLVLEKIPHPYYIERPFLLASYLEQGLIDYRMLESADALAGAAQLLGVTHVAVDVEGLDAARDPFEARVTRLWRSFLAEQCVPVLRAGGFGLYALKSGALAVQFVAGGSRG